MADLKLKLDMELFSMPPRAHEAPNPKMKQLIKSAGDARVYTRVHVARMLSDEDHGTHWMRYFDIGGGVHHGFDPKSQRLVDKQVKALFEELIACGIDL